MSDLADPFRAFLASRSARSSLAADREPSATAAPGAARTPADTSHPASSATPRARGRVGHPPTSDGLPPDSAARGTAETESTPARIDRRAGVHQTEIETAPEKGQLMHQNTEAPPNLKERALAAIRDSAETYSDAGTRATALATLALVEQFEHLTRQFARLVEVSVDQAATMRSAYLGNGARR